MSVMGVSSISPAFPKIVQELAIPDESVGLLITAFTIPGVLLTLPLGIAADRLGRKCILVPALFIFGVAGGLCSLTREFIVLLVLRFIQGIGGAPLNALGVTILGDLYSGQRQKDTISYNASLLSVGTTVYPAIGGILATFGWYYPFALPFIAIPIGLIAIFWLDVPRQPNKTNLIDYIIHAGSDIKSKRVIGLLLSTVVTFFILYGAFMSFFPIFLAQRFNAEPWLIGAMMSSMTLVTALMSSQLPKLSRKQPQFKLLGISFSLYAIAVFILPSSMELWIVLIPLVIYGIGRGMCFPSIQSLLSESSSTEFRAAIMSMNGMAVRVGQTLGPFATGLIFIFGGIEAPFMLCAGLAIANLLPIFILSRQGMPEIQLEEKMSRSTETYFD
jgi:MFS family permease